MRDHDFKNSHQYIIRITFRILWFCWRAENISAEPQKLP